jgi:hypothetical protein
MKRDLDLLIRLAESFNEGPKTERREH